MIEDVKWFKPFDYDMGNKGTLCWIAKNGVVSTGYLSEAGNYYICSSLSRVIPDGVCERFVGQKRPVLR